MFSHHEDQDPADEPAERSLTDNLLPPILGLIGIGALACGVWASGQVDITSRNDIVHCAAVADDHARLACYDKLVTPQQPLKGTLVSPLTHPQDGTQRDRQ
jgi:hypothetical protein